MKRRFVSLLCGSTRTWSTSGRIIPVPSDFDPPASRLTDTGHQLQSGLMPSSSSHPTPRSAASRPPSTPQGIARAPTVSGFRVYDRSCGGFREPERRSPGLLPEQLSERICLTDGGRRRRGGAEIRIKIRAFQGRPYNPGVTPTCLRLRSYVRGNE